ncbi:lanC-like protein GCL1 [Telopea speciosissima]|uniref:lanC-like protein GCL1 n=1 Tax=Telopea speciosissima TaxID=54955 RepID=UPI001CC37C6F|nr:lanC-like protein GCL1 [Telopea speciosissima]
MSSVVEIPSKKHHGDCNELIDPNNNVADITAMNVSLPTEKFLQAAISLKDQVVEATWRGGGVKGSGQSLDTTVYKGLLGTAFTCLRSYEVTGNHQDLLLSAEIIDTCALLAPTFTWNPTFLCGIGGFYALGAVVANYRGDPQRRDYFVDRFLEVAQERALPSGPEEGGFGMPYELLHGRAGFLWAALFINKNLGQETVPMDLLMPVVEAVLAVGRAGVSDTTACPLMYRWHGTRYWGAAHGLAGILVVLLHFPLSGEDYEDVKGTLRYMMRNRFPHSGNYPSSEGNPRDKLVQWSHGATGMAITLCKAAQFSTSENNYSSYLYP